MLRRLRCVFLLFNPFFFLSLISSFTVALESISLSHMSRETCISFVSEKFLARSVNRVNKLNFFSEIFLSFFFRMKSNICSHQIFIPFSHLHSEMVVVVQENFLSLWVCTLRQQHKNSEIIVDSFIHTQNCGWLHVWSLPVYPEIEIRVKERSFYGLGPLNESEQIQEINSKNFLWMKRERRDEKCWAMEFFLKNIFSLCVCLLCFFHFKFEHKNSIFRIFLKNNK